MKAVLEKSEWRPCWIRGSKIAEIAWIGKDVLAWCSGLCIVFFQTLEKRETLRWCWSQDKTGEGTHCLSGHVTSPVFAFSEKVPQPRILVFSYPTMKKISECSHGSNDYLATAFTPHDHLVSLGNFPNYQMMLWSWRTGEKMAAVDTTVRDEVGQILRISQIGPTSIAQMGRTCGKLFVWDLHIVGKTAILKDTEIKLPKDAPVYWVDWKPEPGDPILAITDVDGHIYLSNQDGTNVYRIVLSQRCGVCEDRELPAVCWFRGGIVLKTTFCQIRYYTRKPDQNVWRKEWYLKSATKPCIMVSHPFKNDHLFYHTLEGYLMQIHFPNDETPIIERRLHYGAVYKYMDFVYPWAHHLAVVDDVTDLAILECYSGKQVSRLKLNVKGEISCQASHPFYPLVLLTSNKGELVLVSLLDPENPKISANFRLHEKPLDFIKFSERGEFVLVADRESAICFCIRLFSDKLFKVMALVQTRDWMMDAFLYEVKGKLKLFVLYATLKTMVGNEIRAYDVSGDEEFIHAAKNDISLPGLFRNLSYAPENPQTLIGSSYLSRQLRVLRIQEWKVVNLIESIPSGHQVRQPTVFSNGRWVSTTALDGLVILRDESLKRVVAIMMSHHRYDLGATKAIVNPEGKLVVVLGSNGSLVAMKIPAVQKNESPTSTDDVQDFYRVDFGIYERQKAKIISDYGSLEQKIIDLFSRPDESLEELTDKTWVQWREEVRIRKEEEECAEEKAKILKDFEEIKNTVAKLLDENEKLPEEHRLPISEFDLDRFGREQTLKAAKDERENLRLELEANCNAMEEVTDWMKKTFWDPQKILGRSLFPFYGTEEIANYPSVAEDPLDEERLRWAKFERESVRNLVASETFKPWHPYSDEELEMELSKRVQLYREDEKQRMDTLLAEEEMEDEDVDPEDHWASEGMTTHRFVEPSPHYYSQFESYSPDQVRLDNHFLMDDCNKLRAHFNKLFDEMYALKEREMSLLVERINEIKHIDSELRLMFNESVPEIPAEPEWHWKEKPEKIIVVEDHEVKAKPYVSPSQQELLDKKAAEEERIRQQLLADDFRERALMKMMDGVLEVRWEDTIKLDVPKPDCMLTKKPEEYNAEDIKEVKKYEKDVEFREQERQRYKRILEADYTRIMGLIKQEVDKFNAKFKEFFTVKLKIEAALNQLNLRYARGCLRNHQQVQALEEEDKVKEEINSKRSYISNLQTELENLEKSCQVLREQYEALGSHEKTSGKKFKAEFASLGRITLDILARYYKQRPKTTLKNLRSSDFLELGKHVTAKTSVIPLTVECTEYLKHLNALDSRPTSNLPESVEPSHWDRLVQLRRHRIAQELKQRAKLAEISEAEKTVELFKEKMLRCDKDLEATIERLEKMKKDRILAEQNSEVQLVLKLGQIEKPLEGRLDEMENAVLIPTSEIETVNEEIRAAGASMVEEMKKTANFEQRIRFKEWQHQCLKLDLEDAREELRHVQKAVVTKEIREYLKDKARSFKVDKTPQDAEKEAEAMSGFLEKTLQERVDKLKDLEEQIEKMKKKNERLDEKIHELNVERCELEHLRNLPAEFEQKEHAEKVLKMIMKRSAAVRKLQDNYKEITAPENDESERRRRLPLLEPFESNQIKQSEDDEEPIC